MAATTGVATESTTAPLDPAFVDDFVRRFYDAWNALDGDAVAALCTDDVIWDEPLLPRPAENPQEVKDFVVATKEMLPDFHIEKLTPPFISATKPMVCLPYRLTGTHTGTWSYTGLKATGKRMESDAVDWWTFRGDRLCYYSTYYDTLVTCRQLGILPPEMNSPMDQVLTRITNLKTRITPGGE